MLIAGNESYLFGNEWISVRLCKTLMHIEPRTNFNQTLTSPGARAKAISPNCANSSVQHFRHDPRGGINRSRDLKLWGNSRNESTARKSGRQGAFFTVAFPLLLFHCCL